MYNRNISIFDKKTDKKTIYKRESGEEVHDRHTKNEENKTMREKTIEQKLVQAVKAKGGIAPKFVSPGFSGVPDRLILLPDGKCGFVEVKASGGKPRPLQESRIRLLRQLGFKVYVLDGAEQIGGILDEING